MADDVIIQGDRITFDMQISCFENTRQEIISRIGEHAAKSLLTRSLYFLAIGSNDVTFFKRNTKGKNLSSDAYTDIVISRFRSQLTVNFLTFVYFLLNIHTKLSVFIIEVTGFV